MSGVKRKVDRLGRLVLPKSYRDALGLSENSKVCVSLNDGVISITPTDEKCAMCGNKENLHQVLRLCASCIEKVKSTT